MVSLGVVQVRRFHDDIWNRSDPGAVPHVLAEDVTFRGSPGDVVVGRAPRVVCVRMKAPARSSASAASGRNDQKKWNTCVVTG